MDGLAQYLALIPDTLLNPLQTICYYIQKPKKKKGNVAFQFRAIIGWQYNAAAFAGNVIRPLSENQTHF